jgi:membrane-bound lytic murein transglycosylase B
MKRKTRTIVVTLLGLVLAAGLLAPAALVSQATSPNSQPPQQHAEERLGNTLAEMVQEGAITQEQADAILERVAPILAEASMDARPPQKRIAQHLRGIIRQTVGLLGLEPEAIVAQLREGHTLAEIAEAQGVTREELVNAITADAHEKLSEAVAAGRLSQEEADARLERMRHELARALTHPLPI